MILEEIKVGTGFRCKIQCDLCGKISFKQKSNLRKLQFCSRNCRNIAFEKGNILRKQVDQTNINKYGVDIPMKSVAIQEKAKNTCMKNYGVEYTFQSEEVKNKINETFDKKYGGHPSRTDEFKEKQKETCFKIYGFDNPHKSKQVIDKTEETNLKKYGFKAPAGNIEVQQKAKNTCLQNYGVEYYSQTEEFKNNIDWKFVSAKGHKTKKENGSYSKSKEEDFVYSILCKLFDFNDIERQENTKVGSIDFYIKSIHLYIEYNGSYFHGLDRDINIIKNSTNKTDKIIYQTTLRDKKKLEYFKENNIKFLVLSDNDRNEETILQKIYDLL